MRPAQHPHSAHIYIVLLKQRGIGQIRIPLPPIVKFLRAIVWRNELMQQGQAVWLVKWQ